MKKYICPKANVTNMNVQQYLLEDSATGSHVYTTDADASAEVLSRRRCSVWDDEEDFED